MFALLLTLGPVLPFAAAEAKGRIRTIENEKIAFVLTDTSGKDWMMYLGKDAKVLINDQEVGLSDLRAGDEAEVIDDRSGDRLTASLVCCTRK